MHTGSSSGTFSDNAVVIAARRTPIGRAGGALKGVPAQDLAAPVLRTLLADAGGTVGLGGLHPADVVLGNATGGGGNIARLAALTAGLDAAIPGLSVDRQCGSGLEAVNLAARLVGSGAGELYLAGGVESISTAPARAHRLPDGSLDFFDRARFSPDELGDPDMGVAAENVAAHYGITRGRQDAFALRSHTLALRSAAAGAFDAELVPVAGLAADQGPRASVTAALLARFPAAFVPGGTVTAGNSCPYSDGAAAVVVTTEARARELGATGWLRFVDSTVNGNEPTLTGAGAAHSTRALLGRPAVLAALGAQAPVGAASLLDGVELMEFNEAFAAQVLAVADELGIDPERLNRQGGALALGHPYGASGAVSVVRLFAQARARNVDGDLALAMISIAGGMGISTLFRWERA
ncbi:thiolase family protein [Arthrobacter sp. 35W]|uniref:thiolase family protein n=1 Tax=Arthrobacter sp. 35W TaxID=1132441 RepID=UPI00040DF73D|nr:thiolase family protein [Arthrobacter sp. 35W]